MRQDMYDYQKPCYDKVEQRTINFILTLMIGRSGGLRQGAGQGDVDPWAGAPDSLVSALNYLLFEGQYDERM